MHPVIHFLSITSILCLFLGNLTGCGEKRVHVATLSGGSGPETSLESMDETPDVDPSGLGTDSLDESALLSQDTNNDEPAPTDSHASAATDPIVDNEPVNAAHEPAVASQDEGFSDPSAEAEMALAENSQPTENGDGLNSSSSPESPLASDVLDPIDGSFAPLAEGQDFSAQSSSSLDDPSTGHLGDIEDLQGSTDSQSEVLGDLSSTQDALAALQERLANENIEPVPDALRIAKAEPSGTLQDQLNKMKDAELAAAEAGLEDVFFQFDSWALTPEGKQSLERNMQWFQSDATSGLIIEGHADQRGTQAYNMVLAKKRAVAVRDFLTQLGVDDSRLAVISYGKDKPFCQDNTEVCHQLNRRGHLIVNTPNSR